MPDLIKKRPAADVYAVILVGGKGKRLKPLSTDARPKAFLSITRDGKTMFRKTVERAGAIVPSGNIVVVANRLHSGLVKKDFPDIEKRNLILEPMSRNTAPAITLAALLLQNRLEDPIAVVLPTDQYVLDEGPYLDALASGIDFVRENSNAIVVIGIDPGSPETELGYIKVRGPLGKGIGKVEEFTEKPQLALAKKYVESGLYLWNTGVFIFKAATILRAVKAFAPLVLSQLERLDYSRKAYEMLPDISIDYAVMEKAKNIYCVKGLFQWKDMGSFESLKSILKRESRDFVLRNGKIVKII